MSHATRHALNTIMMSADTVDALDEIAMLASDTLHAYTDTLDLDLDTVECVDEDPTMRYMVTHDTVRMVQS